MRGVNGGDDCFFVWIGGFCSGYGFVCEEIIYRFEF